MYYRNFRPAEKRNENNIPVQYFSDSFSADAFITKEKKVQSEAQTTENATCSQVVDAPTKNENCRKRDNKLLSGNIDFEDLLLLGLLLLFLADWDCREDTIIPVLLGVLLLT